MPRALKDTSDPKLPEFAIDFLGNEIKEGDTIVYPTGGTSARMVRAVVHTIRDLRDQFHLEPCDVWDKEARQWRKGVGKRWVGGGHDGFRGPMAFKLVVHREQEGTRTGNADDQEFSFWKIDTTRKVNVDQLHRVVSITAIERKARATQIIEIGDDMPYGTLKEPGALPPIENIPLWGDGGV